ncbi:MAG TPA: putative C-S lyase [Hydrogenispora sp.]|jgi:cystathionine beta-lyase|nr:putative C-S lyase [Hydrogenispora sp.]
MSYNFDQIIDRQQTNNEKWDHRSEVFGTSDLLPLWVADMDFAVPPCVTAALTERIKHPVYGYSFPPPAFYQAVVDWIARRHQWTIQKDWLVVTSGVVPALALSVLAFTEPGESVIIQPPVYGPFFRVVEQNQRQLVLNPLKEENGRYTMDFDHLESVVNPSVKMMILCSPHNPAGRVWTREELEKLGAFCTRHRILLVSDEIHADLVYPNFKHTPIAALSPEQAYNTITCLAPSKTFNLPGLTTAVTIIPDPERRRRFKQVQSALGMQVYNTLGLTAFTAAYRGGTDWLAALIDYLQGNLDFLLDFFATRIPAIKPVPPEGTYLVWLDCRRLPLTPDELKAFFIHEAKVGLNDGRTFGPGGEGFQRINIACPRPLLAEALHRIEDAVGRLPLE